MCRILAVKSTQEFNPVSYLKNFALISQNSTENQGHGWGCAWLAAGKWQVYKNINPVWQDDFERLPPTTLLLAHARSAFRDEGIVIENNMPFYDENLVFILNGELHGVKIKAEGRIGAEKIFNFIKRFDKGDLQAAISKGVEVIQKQSRYIRAMNFFISDKERIFVSSLFNEAADYFTLYMKRTPETLIVCSEKFPGEENWQTFPNKTIEVFQ